jgi:alkanesulfonate monooxygenase SsuD/methylene tetrahydromethanopterin reductase-like flavin-dependent oxidoreductase (luciferase family)
MLLTFGINLTYTRVHPDETSVGLYAEMRDLAILADQVGFDIVWVPEHHLIQSSQAPSCLMNAVHVGQHTKCRIGTAICPLPYRHPLVWAGELAAADNILEGRLEIGVARGAYRYEFERLGLKFEDSKTLFQETLDAILAQFRSDEAVGHKGAHFNYEPSLVWPRPVQDPHPPVWVGGQTAPTVRWGAASGFDVFNAAFMEPMDHVRSLAAAFQEERAKAGIEKGATRFGVLRQGWVSEDEDELLEKLRVVMMRQRMVTHLVNYDDRADARGYVTPDPVPGERSEEECMENLLFGTPEQVLAKLRDYESAGVDHIILSLSFGLPIDEQLQALQLFGDKVLAPYRAGASAAVSRMEA